MLWFEMRVAWSCLPAEKKEGIVGSAVICVWTALDIAGNLVTIFPCLVRRNTAYWLLKQSTKNSFLHTAVFISVAIHSPLYKRQTPSASRQDQIGSPTSNRRYQGSANPAQSSQIKKASVNDMTAGDRPTGHISRPGHVNIRF